MNLSPPFFSRRIHSSCFFDLMYVSDYLVKFVKEVYRKERWVDMCVVIGMQRE